MTIKRHHVLYGFLALSLMLALLIFTSPRTPNVSFIASSTPTTAKPAASTTPEAFKYEVVTTAAAQERGLGGRNTIPENYGMLFVFQTPSRYGFWMKDMLTSIDMMWLSDTGTILGIEDSVPANSYPKAFYPPQPVRYVLETRAGEARRQKWEVGTNITLPLPYGK